MWIVILGDTVLFREDVKFTVTTPAVAVIEEMAVVFEPKIVGELVTLPVTDAAVKPLNASTPMILYLIV
jgi:hypothetical protein